MFSIIIPTIWSIPHYTLELVKNLVNCELVDDIIIIDNMHEKYISKKAYTHEKVNHVVMDSNIFVNPAWNLGVSLSKNEHIIICNDDVIIEPTKVLKLLLKESNKWDAAGLGPDSYKHNTGGNINLTNVTERTFGWGCFMAIKKSKWVNIPEDIKIFYGDDFIIKTNEKVKNINVPFKVKTKMSSSSSDFSREYMVKDGSFYRNLDFSKYTSFNKDIESKPVYTYLKPKKAKVVKKLKQEDHIFISTVMMSNLSNYQGSRSDAERKLKRALDSFVNQMYSRNLCEIVVVSDGCELTNTIVEKYLTEYINIKLVKTEKSQYDWPGSKRQIGIDASSGNWIAYLDSDDLWEPNHLQNLRDNITNNDEVLLNSLESKMHIEARDRRLRYKSNMPMVKDDQGRWFYLEQYLKFKNLKSIKFNDGFYLYETKEIAFEKYSASRLFHKKDISIKWEDRNARGEDIIFSNKLIKELKCKRVEIPSYIVCHVPNILDI